MTKGYVVSFYPGSAGRFISSIVFRMKNNIIKPIKLTSENSAHVEDDYCDSTKISFVGMEHTPIRLDHKGLFKCINFLPDDKVNVMATHEFPSFTDWQDNNNKQSFDTIFISIDPESMIEVYCNVLLKNTIPVLKKPRSELTLHQKMASSGGRKMWEETFKRKMTAEALEDPVIFKETVLYYTNWFKINKPKYVYDFIDIQIPLDFSSQTLELKYKEMFDKDEQGNFITLTKLSKWLDRPITDDIVADFEKYTQGRINLIQNKMPWLNSST